MSRPGVIWTGISRETCSSRAALVDKLIVAGVGWEKGTLVCIVARNAVLVMNICSLFCAVNIVAGCGVGAASLVHGHTQASLCP
jgi:hypothetical protein